MSQTVLIAFATRAGSTPEIAHAVGETLAARGFNVDVQPVRQVRSLQAYDAVILGSPIRVGNWLPEATAFVRTFQADLNRLPVALFTGPLEHRHLVCLLALADVAVVPSIFPEAFGMVAAEAAAAGCPPLVARHSGLAEIADALEEAYPPRYRRLASFVSGDSIDLADKLHDLLLLSPAQRRELGAAARKVAAERWSWGSVARRLLHPFE